MSRPHTTCHHACDCREAIFAESMATHRQASEIKRMTASEMRNRFGEMTAQEVRTVKAVLNQILPDKP